jgi:hypothetical protein
MSKTVIAQNTLLTKNIIVKEYIPVGTKLYTHKHILNVKAFTRELSRSRAF